MVTGAEQQVNWEVESSLKRVAPVWYWHGVCPDRPCRSFQDIGEVSQNGKRARRADRTGAVGDVKLAENVPKMPFNGSFRDI